MSLTANSDPWPGLALTQAQKVARVKAMIERTGKLLERMADLLEATGRGK